MGLKTTLANNGITQRELAEGIGWSETVVSRILSGELGMGKEKIDAILKFLTRRLGHAVTYEEVFGSPVAAAGGKRS